MKRLTLIRHAKSDWSAAQPDFDRPLNERGKKTAPMMGKRILKRGDIPDLLISSSAKRARKTACFIAQELAIPKDRIIYQTIIYEAKIRTLLTLIDELPELEHIALIGHNPGLTELAEWLCPDSPDWLPTCAVLTLELDIERWEQNHQGCARVLNYDFPKKSA